jgi:ATP-dependent Clp protease adaptor protein ClpS
MAIHKIEGKVQPKSQEKTVSPPRYKVFMHNDDYTTMEFVVSMLVSVFHLLPVTADKVMLQIHMNGIGLCGTFPFEIAETKIHQVHTKARQEGFPLKCSMEEV